MNSGIPWSLETHSGHIYDNSYNRIFRMAECYHIKSQGIKGGE